MQKEVSLFLGESIRLRMLDATDDLLLPAHGDNCHSPVHKMTILASRDFSNESALYF
jgi:hypothetical protein